VHMPLLVALRMPARPRLAWPRHGWSSRLVMWPSPESQTFWLSVIRWHAMSCWFSRLRLVVAR